MSRDSSSFAQMAKSREAAENSCSMRHSPSTSVTFTSPPLPEFHMDDRRLDCGSRTPSVSLSKTIGSLRIDANVHRSDLLIAPKSAQRLSEMSADAMEFTPRGLYNSSAVNTFTIDDFAMSTTPRLPSGGEDGGDEHYHTPSVKCGAKSFGSSLLVPSTTSRVDADQIDTPVSVSLAPLTVTASDDMLTAGTLYEGAISPYDVVATATGSRVVPPTHIRVGSGLSEGRAPRKSKTRRKASSFGHTKFKVPPISISPSAVIATDKVGVSPNCAEEDASVCSSKRRQKAAAIDYYVEGSLWGGDTPPTSPPSDIASLPVDSGVDARWRSPPAAFPRLMASATIPYGASQQPVHAAMMTRPMAAPMPAPSGPPLPPPITPPVAANERLVFFQRQQQAAAAAAYRRHMMATAAHHAAAYGRRPAHMIYDGSGAAAVGEMALGRPPPTMMFAAPHSQTAAAPLPIVTIDPSGRRSRRTLSSRQFRRSLAATGSVAAVASDARVAVINDGSGRRHTHASRREAAMRLAPPPVVHGHRHGHAQLDDRRFQHFGSPHSRSTHLKSSPRPLSSSPMKTGSVKLTSTTAKANSLKIERIYGLLRHYAHCTGSGLRMKALSSMYLENFGMRLPNGTELLKFLVQLPNLVLINCNDGTDMMCFVTDIPAARLIVDILAGGGGSTGGSSVRNGGGSSSVDEDMQGTMTVKHFSKRLEARLNASLLECNVMDFLKRFRVVELVECDLADAGHNLVRLVPMGGCTVFLGNFAAEYGSVSKLRDILACINLEWVALDIRMCAAGDGQSADGSTANALIDFPSLHEAEAAMTQIKRSALYTASVRVEIHSTTAATKSSTKAKATSLIAPATSLSSMMKLVPKKDATDGDVFARGLAAGGGRRRGSHSTSLDFEHSTKRHIPPRMWKSKAERSQSQSPPPTVLPTALTPFRPPLTAVSAFAATGGSSSASPRFGSVVSEMTAVSSSASCMSKASVPMLTTPPRSSQLSTKTFDKLTYEIYELVRMKGGRMLMSEVSQEYENAYGCKLEQFDGSNPKFFVKMERLLLLNCVPPSKDVAIFYTPEPAFKLVVSILKKNAGRQRAGDGLPVDDFRGQLEERMGMSLSGCDLDKFLLRWRFLSVRESADGRKCVLFTPHSGSTVFFGNLSVGVTEEDIFEDLKAADPKWLHASVRLKMGKGFCYAFVDFPTRADALRAVEVFDDTAAFKSHNVSADIEASEHRKRSGDKVRPALLGVAVAGSSSGEDSPIGFEESKTFDSSFPSIGRPLMSLESSLKPSFGSRSVDEVWMREGEHRHGREYGGRHPEHGRHGRERSGADVHRESFGRHRDFERFRQSPRHRGADSVLTIHVDRNLGGSPPRVARYRHRAAAEAQSHLGAKLVTTVYLGNLRDEVTKQHIQEALVEMDADWFRSSIRLNLRSGWSHAFIDFRTLEAANRLIKAWNNKPHPLTTTRLRCEVSKKRI